MKLLHLLCFTILSSSLVAQGFEVKSIEGSIIKFENGKTINTQLVNLKIIDVIYPENKPYLILSGRGCELCDANISIYFHSPLDGDMNNESSQARYSYPGEIYDPFTGDTVFYSDFYYGNCLSENSMNLVWVQNGFEEQDTKKEIFYIEHSEGNTIETFVKKNVSLLELKIQKSLDDGCFQLAGISQTTEM